MKVRIRFSKTGALVYIGHLDVMRYFQKLFRRAQIPVAYSEGFSPHQILSFTPPLPLGMESEGEYADVTLTERITTEEALIRLRRESVPEITIHSFKELPEKCENAMAAVRAAGYHVVLNDDLIPDLNEAVNSLMNSSDVRIIKKTKKNEKEINIRPLIYELEAGKDRSLKMLISSGSTDNIKPEHVLDALYKCTGSDINQDTVVIKRLDQYTMTDKIISLDGIGRQII